MPKFNIYLKGFVGDWDFSSDMVSAVLNKHSNAEVNVLISSLGGETAEALLIGALIKQHAQVNVHYIGMNASAATVVSMGAKHISMDVDALYLVHRCLTAVVDFELLNSDGIDRRIKELQDLRRDADVFDLTVAAMYARRCKKPKEELLKLMSEERWLTAKEALDWGFIDEITDDAEDKVESPDSKTVNAMCCAGLPVPPVVKKDSMFNRFLAWLDGASRHAENNIVKHNAEISLADYSRTSSILGEKCSSPDGDKFLLSNDQIMAVEAELERLNVLTTDLAEQIAALQSQSPAVDFNVTESPKDYDDSREAINARALELFNSLK